MTRTVRLLLLLPVAHVGRMLLILRSLFVISLWEGAIQRASDFQKARVVVRFKCYVVVKVDVEVFYVIV